MKKLIVGIAVAAVLAGGGYAAWTLLSNRDTPEPAPTFTVTPITVESLTGDTEDDQRGLLLYKEGATALEAGDLWTASEKLSAAADAYIAAENTAAVDLVLDAVAEADAVIAERAASEEEDVEIIVGD